MTLQSIQQDMSFKDKTFSVQNLTLLEKEGIAQVSKLPFAARVLIENLARHAGDGTVDWEDVVLAARFYDQSGTDAEFRDDALGDLAR